MKRELRRVVADPSKAGNAKNAQDEAAKAMDKVIWRTICSMKLDTYVGEEINGVKLTPSGLIAGYRLAGMAYHTNSPNSRYPGPQPGLEAYLRSNGELDGREDYGTPISAQIVAFNDYDVPFQKIHDGPAGSSVAKPRTSKKKVDKKADTGINHPHAAETSAWYQQDYYSTKHWNIASRLYSLNPHDDSDDGWKG